MLSRRGKISPITLDVSRGCLCNMRSGIKSIPDRVLEKILKIADDDDLAQVSELARFVDYSQIRRLDAERIVRLFVEWTKANPASIEAAIDTIQVELERSGLMGKAWARL